MPLIQVKFTTEEAEILSRVARENRRSKREQVAFSAMAHARSLISPATALAVAETSEKAESSK